GTVTYGPVGSAVPEILRAALSRSSLRPCPGLHSGPVGATGSNGVAHHSGARLRRPDLPGRVTTTLWKSRLWNARRVRGDREVDVHHSASRSPCCHRYCKGT